MQFLEIGGIKYPFDQLKWEVPHLDLIAWLFKQPLYPKVFWQEKEQNITYAAVGSLLSFAHVPSISDSADVRLYGGMRFAKKTHPDETWRGFPQTCFWLPQIEISQEGKTTHALVQSLNEKSSNLPFDFTQNELLASNDFPLIDRVETPDFSLWSQNVEDVLEKIHSGHLEKLVLARKSNFHFSTPLSPWPILAHLRSKASQATVFAFQLSPHVCFLGATPEKLFKRDGLHLGTDAIAGTHPRGKTPEEDSHIAGQLLKNAKEKREFQSVSTFLQQSLQPISETFNWEWSSPRTLKTSHVQHIYNRLSARLKPGITDAELIRLLHPTPALGGFPRERALPLLSTLETFDRGWYGAPIGMISSRGTSLYAGIRCALIRERTMHLFAGTGLVEGSIPEREWDELEQKIRPFTEFLSQSYVYSQ